MTRKRRQDATLLLRGAHQLNVGERFGDIHQKGAKEFGFRWLKANQAAYDACINYGFDVAESRVGKAFISELVYKILAAS
jgi:hypothetical protein